MLRKATVIVAIALLLLACGRSRNRSSPAIDLMKEVASEVRAKPRVQLLVRMNADEPSPEDRALLQSLENAVDNGHIGRLVSSGTAAGSLSVTVEVESSADAIAKLQSVLRSAGVLERSSFKVIAPEP